MMFFAKMVKRRRWAAGLVTGQALFCLLFSVTAQEGFTGVDVDAGKLVKQQLYPDSSEACGPAAMLNVLRQGTPKMQAAYASLVGADERRRLRFVIDRYFNNKVSMVFPRAKRLGHHGVFPLDLKNACNDLLKENGIEALSRLDLSRKEGEADRDFLQRVHGELKRSLRRGVPPIIQLRSYAALRDKQGDAMVMWQAANNHFVVVTRVPSELRAQDDGFAMDLIDPNGGRLLTAYVFGERHLPFRAEQSVSSPAPAKWLTGRPFLLVKAPGVVSLQPRKATWEDRVIVTLSEAIGRF